MARTDNDTWEITESVGATALGVAAARAADTESEDPLIDDPFARVFLEAAGDGMWNWFGSSDLPAEIAKIAPDVPLRMQGMRDYMASRTAYFDEFFIDATEAGVRQVVILAAGLDSRSWRLPWPDGVTVYELDQPKVLEFKSSTLRHRGAQPTANLVNVPIDLRQDWPTALRQAGFDAAAPSAFTAEGLLPFLPSAAQDLLFERIQALTAVGSQIAVEAPGPEFNDPEARERQRSTMQRYRALATQLGGEEHDFPEFEDLWYFENRTDVGDWLLEHGWDVSVLTSEDMMAIYDRQPPEGIEDGAPGSLFCVGAAVGVVARQWHNDGMNRIRLSTTVDARLLGSARSVRSGITDAALIDEALKALLARYRSAALDASYAAYDEHPAEEPDEWGDLATWRRAAGAS